MKKLKHFLVSVLCMILCTVMLCSLSTVVFADDTKAAEKASDASEEEYRDKINDLQDEQVKIQEEMDDYKNKISNIKDDKKKTAGTCKLH